MKVYGLDFTSNPTNSKRLTLADCELDKDILAVKHLHPLASKKAGDFSSFESWLKGENGWSEERWIAGLDFPFGMAVEAIEHFQWLSEDSAAQTWSEYLTNLFQEDDSDKFCKLIEKWRHSTKKNKKGEFVRVRKARLTDKLAGSGTPMNCYPPVVCPMFFQGAKRLLECPKGTTVLPVRSVPTAKKVIVEAYPRLVANVFIGRNESYKDRSSKKHSDKEKQAELRRRDKAARKRRRKKILDGLACDKGAKPYGFRLVIPESLETDCLNDIDGDKLDSVLCAVQAAWAFNAPNNGMPTFALQVLQSQIQLEGWIADPYVLQRLADGDS